METVTNAASTVASAASRAIWGDTSNTATTDNETKGQEPLSGETGDVKSGEPYDKGNAEPTVDSDPKSLAKTSSKEIPSESTAEIASTSKIEPLEPQKLGPTPTETLETTKIQPLEDTTKDATITSSGISQEVKTGSSGTDDVATGVKKLDLNDSTKNDDKRSNPLPVPAKDTPGSSSANVTSTKDDAKEHKLSGLKEKIKAKLHHNKS